MSQRPSASRPVSRSPPDGQGITLPPVQLGDDPQQQQQRGRQVEGPPGQEARGLQQRQQQQQQQQQLSPQHARTSRTTPPAGEEWRSSGPSRDLGVHSMLNPTEPSDAGSSSRRLSGALTESPISASARPAGQFGTSPSTASQHTFLGQQPANTPPAGEGYSPAFPRRRILTPRSPRAVSIGRGGGAATIDAQQSPFLYSRGRPYTAEPGTSAAADIPPMPTPPAQTQAQQQYGFPPAASTPSVDQRPSISGMQAPSRTPLSQSASPSVSTSSQNPSSQPSPASFMFHKGGTPSQSGTSYFPGSTFGTSMQQQGGLQFPAPPASEGPYSALQTGSLQSSTSSSRQTSASDPIQVLTITTSQGLYHVPVDVHQASRLADEKRARNAGASARFRQRRKEKEKEASTNIEKLQQQARDLERKVREVEQERDFYRAERDRFRDVVFRTPGIRDLAMQAPPSPHSARAAPFQGPSAAQPAAPPPPMGFQTPEGGSERSARRRKTDPQSDFTSLPYTLPPSSTLPPVQSSSYPPGPGQGPPNLPPLRIDNTSAPQTTSTIAPSISAGPPTSYDPYPIAPYGRSWPSEGGRR